MKKNLTILLLLLCSGFIKAQTEGTSNPLSYSAYVETYYSYASTQPREHNLPSFVYSYNRHNEVNINLAYLKSAYKTNTLRGNIALMTGTYTNANLAAEPGVLKNIYEANVGVKLSESSDVWLDAGIFSSHIGFESAVGKDCFTLTRSMMADNTPYYESGVKITYNSPSGNWLLSGLVLNGWQRISRVNGNNTPCLGTQAQYKTSDILLNSSTFIGSDTPDSITRMRYFHNFYAQFLVSNAITFLCAFDIGAQQSPTNTGVFNVWYSPNVVFQFKLNDNVSITARAEYYADNKGVIIPVINGIGFQTSSASLNLDYQVEKNMVWRSEIRAFGNSDGFLRSPGSNDDSVLLIGATSLALSL